MSVASEIRGLFHHLPKSSYRLTQEAPTYEPGALDISVEPRPPALSLGFRLIPQPVGTDIWMSIQDSSPMEFESVVNLSDLDGSQHDLRKVVDDVIRGEALVILERDGGAAAVKSMDGAWSIDAGPHEQGAWAQVVPWL